MSNELITPAAMFLHKKNAARKILAQKGTLKREGSNTYDNYTYFSEAQYKKLFTEIFSEVGLEMTCDETSIVDIQGTDKQRFGRRVTLKFTLSDIDTGYSEVSHSTGEGFDKGDKAIYKAKIGALKYWLAAECDGCPIRIIDTGSACVWRTILSSTNMRYMKGKDFHEIR